MQKENLGIKFFKSCCFPKQLSPLSPKEIPLLLPQEVVLFLLVKPIPWGNMVQATILFPFPQGI